MEKIRIAFILFIFSFFHCATTQISARKEPLSDDIIEKKVQMEIVKSPIIDLRQIISENGTITNKEVNLNYIVKVQEYLRKRHNYKEIGIYERRLHSLIKYSMFIGGLGIASYGTLLLINGSGYVVLGRDLMGIGLITSLPALIFSKPKHVEKVTKKFEDDQSLTPYPLKDKKIKIEIKNTQYSKVATTNSDGEIIIPINNFINQSFDTTNITLILVMDEQPAIKTELIISSSLISSFKKWEEWKKQEDQRLAELKQQEEVERERLKKEAAKLEEARKRYEKEIEKTVQEKWKTIEKLGKLESISLDAEGNVKIHYRISKSEKKACIDAGKWGGVSDAIELFKTTAWIQYTNIAPTLFKKSYIESVELTMIVTFSAIINPSHTCEYPAINVKMKRTTAKNINWARDVMKKDPEDVADSFTADEIFRIFLLDGFEKGAFYDTWE